MFFVPFIIMTPFTVLNLLIALVVDPMQSPRAGANEILPKGAVISQDERELLLRRIDALADEVQQVHKAMR